MGRVIPVTILLSFLLLFSGFGVIAQNADDADSGDASVGVKPDTARFFFGTPSHKVVSRYARLEFVDRRADTATIGMITTNTRYDIQVVPGWPLGEQFGSLFFGNDG